MQSRLSALTLALAGAMPSLACAATDTAAVWQGHPLTGPTAPAWPNTPIPSSAPTPRTLASSSTQNSGYQINPASREAVRLFYQTVFASSNQVPSDWTGDISSCNAGSTSSDYQAATLRRINWFRAMAGVPAQINLDSQYNRKAQQTALMMSAQNALSHYPDNSWACYSAEGAEGARYSNLALGRAGASAVADGYIRDDGSNNAPVGHRRWLLYPQTKIMGVGDVTPNALNANALSASAIWVFDNQTYAPRPPVRDDFVAWPPAGFIPYQTIYPRWSFSYPGADFSAASIHMTENGQPLATRPEALHDGYGENTLVWLPGNYTDDSLWNRPSADTVYQVTISNVKIGGQTRSFSYQVIAFDPNLPGSDTPMLQPSGATALQAGQTSSYQFAGHPAATGFQWRAISPTPLNLNEGAESDSTAVLASTSSDYSPIASDVSASGGRSFHLAHTQRADQILLLQHTLLANSSTSLNFASRLGLSSPSQVALVEVSTDEGQTWQEIYRQAGQQSGTTSNFGEFNFSQKSISLAAFAEQTIWLRWRYALLNGSFYNQSSKGIGWYIDDIQLSGAEVITSASAPSHTSSNTHFDYTAPGNTAQVVLQVRPGMYGYYDGWSKGLRVQLQNAPIPTATNCLFHWAERMVPELLWPAANTQSTGRPPFNAYRYYSGSASYLGISALDQRVYFQQDGQSLDLGPAAGWLSAAGCQ
ncbi:MAG: CAP domain-containing protein [Giesbergeria sp.]|uniref:CAP domain-containing protein n=1 Tax=Giesbergeria sp. TaxID=2818473 RepID=UPI00261390FD|nr:CAP domain-containing protein [Giesbergeria sp.]MDD2608544.1 CAP domain-containing protein [Giesbergeria sp.]